MSFLSSAKIQLQNTNTSSKHSVPICNGQFGCYFLFWMEIATSWAHLQLQEKRIQILLLFRIPFYSVIKEYPQIQIVDCFGVFFLVFLFACYLLCQWILPFFFSWMLAQLQQILSWEVEASGFQLLFPIFSVWDRRSISSVIGTSLGYKRTD